MYAENKIEGHGYGRSQRVSARGIALAGSGLVLALALLCLLAYLLNAPTLGGFFPGGVPMAPATALCFLLLSGTLLLWQTSLAWKRGAVKAAAAMVLLVSADVLFKHLHEAMHTGAIPLWKMSPFTAGLFILSAAGLLRLGRLKPGADLASMAVNSVLMALSSLILLGYLYGSPFFYGGTVIPVAFTSGAAFFVLSIALFASDPESVKATPFFGDSLKAVLFRNFLPLTVGAVLLDGVLDLGGLALFGSRPALAGLYALAAMGAAALMVNHIAKRVGDQVAQAQQKQQASERRLADSQSLLRSVVDNTPALVYMLDKDRRFTAVSKSLAAFFGRPAAELTGKRRAEIMPAEIAEKHEENDRLVLERNGPLQFEETAFSPDRGEQTFLTTKFPLKIASGEIVGVGGVSVDITERKRAEVERERANRQLAEQKQDMENLLYVTTHDLRGPLVNIHGFSENLLKDVERLRETVKPAVLPDPARDVLNELAGGSIPVSLNFIIGSVASMNRVINTLLKVARLGQVEMRPEKLYVDAVLKDVLNTLRFQLEEAGCAVKTGGLPPCRADAGAMTHIFTNLIANAIKYRDKSRKLEITVKGEVTGGAVLYAITDNGLGIKEENLPRIWEFFYSGAIPGVEKGEGIGLPMIRRMAEKNSGRIWAESKEGAGSTFFVEMPAG